MELSLTKYAKLRNNCKLEFIYNTTVFDRNLRNCSVRKGVTEYSKNLSLSDFHNGPKSVFYLGVRKRKS